MTPTTDSTCRCGSELRYAFDQLGCLACGAVCCPACAVHVESVSYCASCAGRLDAGPIRSRGSFELR